MQNPQLPNGVCINTLIPYERGIRSIQLGSVPYLPFSEGWLGLGSVHWRVPDALLYACSTVLSTPPPFSRNDVCGNLWGSSSFLELAWNGSGSGGYFPVIPRYIPYTVNRTMYKDVGLYMQ